MIFPPMTPFVGENFNMTRAGVHADGLMKNQEIYNIFDTTALLNCPPKVSVTNTSGIAGVAFWMNQYFRKIGKPEVDKSAPIVQKVHEWVSREYENGRVTMISDEELTEQVNRHMTTI